MNKEIKSFRQSGIELLRIVSMLFVVLMHINGFSNLNPCDQSVALEHPLFSSFRFFLEAFVIVGVNCFVLISGWFGIKANVKGLLKFVFQVVFLYFVVYLVLVLLNLRPVSLSHLLSCFTLGYWFVHAYLILYIISPILNAFVTNVSPKSYLSLLVCFLLYQVIYGWLKPVSESIHMGYSPVSFMGLYLLARYIRLYGIKLQQWKVSWLTLVVFGCVLINTIGSQMLAMVGYGAAIEQIYYYCNPLIIIQAVALLLIFSRLGFHSRFVNWVACSCFAVYLIHMHPMVRDLFFDEVAEIWKYSSYVQVLVHFVLLTLLVYSVSILVDKVRIAIWQILIIYSIRTEKKLL